MASISQFNLPLLRAEAKHAYEVGDTEKAYQNWMYCAKQGDAESMFCVGKVLYGRGEYRQALLWYTRAAKQGYVPALNEAGNLFRAGEGIDANPEAALNCYLRAADEGYAPAQCNAAAMLTKGQGAPADPKAALELYFKAAAQGDARAQFHVGEAYANGGVVAANPRLAFQCYQKAAEQGYVKAQFALGQCYYYGKGVDRSLEQAVRWLREPANQGYPLAESILQEYESRKLAKQAAPKPPAPAPEPTNAISRATARLPKLFARQDKERITLMLLGRSGDGKSTLAQAIPTVLRRQTEPDAQPVQPGSPEKERAGAVVYTCTRTYFESKDRKYTLVDPADPRSAIAGLISGGITPQGAILVVDGVTGVNNNTMALIMLAKDAGIRTLVVFMNHVEGLSEDQVYRLEEEVLFMLEDCGYPEETPLVSGSALAALMDRTDRDHDAILDLVDILDDTIPAPDPLDKKPFLMVADEVRTASAGGVELVGKVAQGGISPREDVELFCRTPGEELFQRSRHHVSEVRQFRRNVDRIKAGEEGSLSLRAVDVTMAQNGSVAAAPGYIKSCSRFRGILYMIPTSQGGSDQPIHQGDVLQCRLFSAEVDARVRFVNSVRVCMPGQYCLAELSLPGRYPVQPDRSFTLRLQGNAVAVGRVVSALD